MSEVSLGLYFDAFIEQQIRAGRFRDAREVLCAGLQLLEARERAHDDRLATEINDAFEDGGEDAPLEDVFARLEALAASETKAQTGGA
jgi:putative addiction module CopG family antidote